MNDDRFKNQSLFDVEATALSAFKLNIQKFRIEHVVVVVLAVADFSQGSPCAAWKDER